MDEDSSSKFIGSLTKFLQSLCNGYVEFQRGVELVGHIYLNIDTGEKVDYILHEKVNKNDENSVSFVSNSFHAQDSKKDKKAKKDTSFKAGAQESKQMSDYSNDDDDDIVIVDKSSWAPGSTNTGTVSSRGLKRSASDQQQAHHTGIKFLNRGHGNSNPVSSPSRSRQHLAPPTTATNQNMQDNMNIGEVKLEQISADELLSLTSQVNEGPSHEPPSESRGGRIGQSSHLASLSSSAGQPVWIKQEAPDDAQGGHDTGWSRGRDGQSDSSNSGSDLYPTAMHHNPAYSSNPAFPGFPSPGMSSAHQGQSHPGMSGNPYVNPVPGTSQGMMSGIDPSVICGESFISRAVRAFSQQNEMLPLSPSAKKTLEMRRYRERLRRDPVRYRRYLDKQNEYAKRRQERMKTLAPLSPDTQ